LVRALSSAGLKRLKMPLGDWNDYELIDFGEGRKLERWGHFWLNRPSPAAELVRQAQPTLWQKAHGQFLRTPGEQGQWHWSEKVKGSWELHFGPMRVEVSPTPFGHLGLFPEQRHNWKWIAAQNELAQQPLKILNLFAYTGASTLAAAHPRNEIVHVDASKSSVAKARRNASLSGFDQCKIRWIVEDVPKFCRRELKRGNQYDAIILDPPTYGHGPKGEPWTIDQHLNELLHCCQQLWSENPAYFLLTSHSESMAKSTIKQLATSVLPRSKSKDRRVTVEAGSMDLETKDHRRLNSGRFARWTLEAGKRD
jgi:23S rRNA (cytosine1962-C5)-methyltransferase